MVLYTDWERYVHVYMPRLGVFAQIGYIHTHRCIQSALAACSRQAVMMLGSERAQMSVQYLSVQAECIHTWASAAVLCCTHLPRHADTQHWDF